MAARLCRPWRARTENTRYELLEASSRMRLSQASSRICPHESRAVQGGGFESHVQLQVRHRRPRPGGCRGRRESREVLVMVHLAGAHRQRILPESRAGCTTWLGLDICQISREWECYRGDIGVVELGGRGRAGAGDGRARDGMQKRKPNFGEM